MPNTNTNSNSNNPKKPNKGKGGGNGRKKKQPAKEVHATNTTAAATNNGPQQSAPPPPAQAAAGPVEAAAPTSQQEKPTQPNQKKQSRPPKKQKKGPPQPQKQQHVDPTATTLPSSSSLPKGSVSPPPPSIIETEDTIATTSTASVSKPAAGKPQKGGSSNKTGMTKAQRKAVQAAKHRLKDHGDQHAAGHDDDDDEDQEGGGGGSHDNGGNRSGEDISDTQNERAKEYRKGGYHPVVVGDVYNDRYRIVKKLGWGYFSTVWLVWDYVASRFQALKVQKSASHYREAAFDEIRLLSEIMGADENCDRCCARMTDYFEHVGPNGTHVCMVFDVLGENLLSLMEWYEYRGIPLPIVKAIAEQVLIGLEHIHSIDIIHTDLKPENVLLASPKHKIISIMKHYVPPPLYKRPSLLERDVKNMTKSQKRRYYQKLKKGGGGGGGGAGGAAAGGEGAGGLDDETSSTGKGGHSMIDPNPEANQPTESPTLGPEAAEEPLAHNEKNSRNPDNSGVVLDKNGVVVDGFSDTDPEWEVERFHHVCVADFGNSCWTHKQFTDEVQTRQYRSPEVILGQGYSTPIDLWSLACMIFELLTGDFLFDPKQGDDYSRDEDHLALMTELLGELPEPMRFDFGKFRAQFYNSRGELRNIKQLKYWDLPSILHEKYRYTKKKAAEIAEFLLPMLALDPQERATATEMLTHFRHFFQVQEDDYAPLTHEPNREPSQQDEEEEGSTHSTGQSDEESDERRHDDMESTMSDEVADDEQDEGGSNPRLRRRKSHNTERTPSERSDDDDDGDDDTVDAEAPRGRPEGEDMYDESSQYHRSHQQRASSADEAELREWWRNHPLLNEEALRLRGLTIKDVQVALLNQPLETEAKQVAVEDLLQQIEAMMSSEDDGNE